MKLLNKSTIFGIVGGILIGLMLGILAMLIFVKHKREEIALLSGLAANYSLEKGMTYDSINYLMIAKYFDPENIEYHSKLGYIFYDFGLYDFAQKEFQQALNMKNNLKNYDVNRAMLYCNIGTMHWKSDEHEKAIESFRLALREDPRLPESLFAIYKEGHLAETTNMIIQTYFECLLILREAGFLPETISEELIGN